MRVDKIKSGDVLNRYGMTYNPHDYPDMKLDNLHFIYPLAKYDLSQFIASCSESFNLKMIKKIFLQICLAVEFMHAKDYIHRDIKPENILICEDESDSTYKCKICDFGISKTYYRYDSHSPLVATVYYRAPELALGYQGYDNRIDSWSIACVFYEVFCGRKLFFDIDRDDSGVLLSKMLERLPYVIPIDYVRRINSSFVSSVTGLSKTNRDNFLSLILPLKSSTSERDMVEFKEVLFGGLEFNHEKRWTVTKMIGSKFFSSESQIVDQVRKMYPPVPSPPVVAVTPPVCNERHWMVSKLRNIFTSRRSIPWCSGGYGNVGPRVHVKVFFLTIYNFDRMLFLTQKVRTQFDLKETFLYVLKILHLSHRVYSCSPNAKKISFFDMLEHDLKTQANINKANLFEDSLVSSFFNYKIKVKTVYDYALTKHAMNEGDIMSLFNFTLMGCYWGHTPQSAYEKWSKNKSFYLNS
jgi:serine/threonine protein kinase